ncbi:acetyl-CoA carboxylase biotin carboxylase subunit [Lactiplantibacillus plantarum]|uniref:acetyl-CoA carboxylase biotin carboxylase subunit n=1 Tax=Lactiplantibacillus plantarum TaxID=1590 RepID=UPI003EE64463
MFKKILVANRGEIAIRIIRAAKELGIKTVAVYSSVDRDALHVKVADQSICIGPGPTKDSYLNKSAIIMAALMTNADALHPGYGFLSEDYLFAKEVRECGISYIGPSTKDIETMGNKVEARQLVERLKIPTVPGRSVLLNSQADLLKEAKRLGFPVMLKAALGGGGKGIRLISSETELITNFNVIQKESTASFGRSGVYIEKYLDHARHIEVQVLGESNGKMHILGERGCSLQLKHQKVIEEAPATVLNEMDKNTLFKLALTLVKSIHYLSLGTLEFLFQDGNFYFLEMNTRVQVEHPVTEFASNLDLIELQIRVATNEKLNLPEYVKETNGNSIECRLTAQDPFNKFQPSIGKISSLVLPSGGKDVRIDEGITDGTIVSPYYDSLLAKIIVKGSNRDEAIKKMQGVLTEIHIEGIKTNLPFLKEMICDKRFVKNSYSTVYLDNKVAKV